MSDKFAKQLEEALSKKLGIGTMVHEETPEEPELEGKSKKSPDGPHRPDPGTEYTQMEQDKEFENRDYDYSDQARPELSKD